MCYKVAQIYICPTWKANFQGVLNFTSVPFNKICLEGNFVTPIDTWFVFYPIDMPLCKKKAKWNIRDISSLSEYIKGKIDEAFTAEFILKAFLRKADTACFLTQAGPPSYPRIFSFSLDMTGWHQPPGKLQKWKSCQCFPWLMEFTWITIKATLCGLHKCCVWKCNTIWWISSSSLAWSQEYKPSCSWRPAW